MIATDCGRWMGRILVAVAALGAASASAQLAPRAPRGAARGPAQAPPRQAAPEEPKVRLDQGEQIRQVETAVPVNPSDPIAVVNGEPITRAQLADECVARKGQEILDTLVARRIIEQAIKTRKLEVTAAEIDQEIEDVAEKMAGVGREAWLRTLDKERGISPVQYARDIIYPTIALRKLAHGRVQVTEKDIRDAMDANFGPKLYARIITVDKERTAIEIWEELKKNPDGFDKIARDRSTDQATRALGGFLSTPISRHLHPVTVSDPAFHQLVDGDAKDSDPTHKPKDGDITGPIQVNDMAWIIIKRERLDPAREYDPKDAKMRAFFHGQIQDAKLKDAISKVFAELMDAAAIDNRLTGNYKEPHEKDHPDVQDMQGRKVRLMNGQVPDGDDAAVRPAAASAPSGVKRASAPPVGLPSDLAEKAQQLQKPLARPKP